MVCFLPRPRKMLASAVIAGFALIAPGLMSAAAVVPFTLANTLAANDDGSTDVVNLNLNAGGINFFGQTFTDVYVNNNGNVTFGAALGDYTPNGLETGVGHPIIAPFFADVDTRAPGSSLVAYGNGTYDGRSAFVVNWVNVGYYNTHDDKLNSFQLILTDRSDTGTGNFDIQFNYDKIQWETGDASGGENGLGGTSAVAGYANGLAGGLNVYYQLPGSLVNGALLDGGSNSLVAGSLNSDVAGRYNFQVRNGAIVDVPSEVPEPSTFGFMGAAIIAAFAAKRRLLN